MEKNKITLGLYPQNGEDCERLPIEWICLKQEENRILCVSELLLDCKPYNETLMDVTWENCTLRRWLNNDFFNTAFTREEQSRVLLSNIETPLHNTNDYIFILSCDDAERYFDFNERAAKTTQYARNRGAWFLDENENKYVNHGSWWLRYPEFLEEDDESVLYDTLSCVNFDGYIEGAADEVTASTCCVRPAFWYKTH